jgi:hypothetical protein
MTYTIEETEGATNNGQSRDTGNTGYKTQNMKTNTEKNTSQKTKQIGP